MQLSGIRTKISAWEKTDPEPMSRSGRSGLGSISEGDAREPGLIGAVKVPSSKILGRNGRETQPHSSIMFAPPADRHAEPLPGPKQPPSAHTLAAALAAEASQVVAAVRSAKTPAASTRLDASDDLMALKCAVEALKVSQVLPVMQPAPAARPTLAPAYEAHASREILASSKLPAASDLLSQKPAAVAVDLGTPVPKAASKTPAPPANTPASPLVATATGFDRSMPVEAARVAQAIQDVHVECAACDSPAPHVAETHHEVEQEMPPPPAGDTPPKVMPNATPVVAPSPAITEYDGDDVVMGDATPTPVQGKDSAQ